MTIIISTSLSGLRFMINLECLISSVYVSMNGITKNNYGNRMNLLRDLWRRRCTKYMYFMVIVK